MLTTIKELKVYVVCLAIAIVISTILHIVSDSKMNRNLQETKLIVTRLMETVNE